MTKVIKFNDKEGSVKETVRCKMSLRSRCWCSWGLAGHLFLRHMYLSSLGSRVLTLKENNAHIIWATKKL